MTGSTSSIILKGDLKTDLVIRAVSFASEGHPYDSGLPIGRNTLEEYGKMCIKGGASTFIGYTPQVLNTPEDSWSVRAYSEEHAMPINPGYHLVGLGAWRILILQKEIEISDDGDVVVVHCANFIKYPNFRHFSTNIRRFVSAIVKFTDTYCPMHCNNGLMAGAQTFDLIDDEQLRDKIAQAPMGQCRLIVMKVTQKNRDFINILVNLLKGHPDVLSPMGKTPYKGMKFWRQCAEQSVFNIMAYREGIFPINWESSWISPLRHTTDDPDSGGNRIVSLNLTR